MPQSQHVMANESNVRTLCGVYIQCPLFADGEKKAEAENRLVSFHQSRSSSLDCSNVESRVLSSYFYSKNGAYIRAFHCELVTVTFGPRISP